MDNRAPIFADTFGLCQWLLERLDSQPGVLARTICNTGLKLLEAIALALKGRLREERLEEADERLITLRLQLRLAETTGLLTEDQTLFALENAARIGRQLGGWQRSLHTA
jgi:hypothetical protein